MTDTRIQSGQPSGAQLPLSMVREGTTVRVTKVRGDNDMRRHLENLGFVEGAEIKVVSQSGASGTIASVKGSQFGVDRRTAMHVYTIS